MLKTKLFKNLGSVITAAALLISSQAIVFAENSDEDAFVYPELAASYDFANQTGDGITVRNNSGQAVPMSVVDGAGKMEWFHNIYTDKSYKNAVVEFDYEISPEKPENVKNDAGEVTTWAEVRLDVHFGNGDGNAANWSYIDFIKDEGGVPHYVASYNTPQDQLFEISEAANDFRFYQNTEYSFRYVVNGNSVQLYAKPASDTVYTYIGEKTGLDIPSGLIYIHSSQFAYIKNLKVYADTVKVSIDNGSYISAENAKINVTMINDIEVNDSNVVLKQNGSVIACDITRSGNNLTITPSALETNKEYTLWLSEEITGERGGKTIVFKTLPELAASYDFANNANSGFDIKTSGGSGQTIAIENGEGKLWWECIPITEKGYQNAVTDFDFRWDSADDGRLCIYFGVEDFANSGYFSYIDFNSASNSPHFFGGDMGDGFFQNGSGFGFEKNVDYSVRYVIDNQSVKLYAKKAADADYTYAGERTGINIPGGKIKIYCDKQYMNVKSIKVYANTTKVSVKDGAAVSSELAKITVILPEETLVNNSQINLTQNGNKVGYTLAQNGRTLTIAPILKPQKEYVLWLSEDITGETGGVTVNFITMPAVSASWDFTNDVNNGFDVKNSLIVADGEGKMSWDTKIITKNSYKHAILDFDYRLESLKGEKRFNVGFGADENGNSANFCYMDIDGSSTPKLHQPDDDYLFKNGSAFVFKDSVTYSYRYIVNSDSVKFYAKEENDAEYTFIGEVTGLNIPDGKMTIDGKEYGYIKNLKVYGYVTDNYDYIIKNASYNPTTKSFTADIKAVSVPASAKAAVASYSDSGLNDVKFIDIEGADKEINETVEPGIGYKVMIFGGESGIEPMAELVTFN